uniref:Uncharacterized protein n=2 Tax=Avena sativa TaxID=4498 RepID=A0ACD5ZVS0_AVESA
MDQFHDRQHVWLRSRVRGTYLHADDDGVGVSLSRSRASMNAAWAVHLYLDDRDGRNIQYVLLHSAAYGRYLAATDASAPIHLCGLRLPRRAEKLRPDAADGRHQVAGHPRWVGGAQGRQIAPPRRHPLPLPPRQREVPPLDQRRYRRRVHQHSMMQWVVEPILPRPGMPRLPGPISDRLPGDLSVVILRRPVAAWRSIPYVRAADDGSYPAEAWVDLLQFMGRSVHCLREQLAIRLWKQFGVFDFIMCVRAGREGRLTPLVVHLPRHGTIEIVVITKGTPDESSAELRYPDVDAE